MSQYVCGADIAFDNHHQKFAIDTMGCFDTVEDAVIARKELHPAFSYEIYETERTVTRGLRRSFGFRQESPCSGYKILKTVCIAYEHPAWRCCPTQKHTKT